MYQHTSGTFLATGSSPYPGQMSSLGVPNSYRESLTFSGGSNLNKKRVCNLEDLVQLINLRLSHKHWFVLQ